MAQVFQNFASANRVYIVPESELSEPNRPATGLLRVHNGVEYMFLAPHMFPNPDTALYGGTVWQDTSQLRQYSDSIPLRRKRMQLVAHESSHSNTAGGPANGRYLDAGDAPSGQITANQVGEYCGLYTDAPNPWTEPDECPEGSESDDYGCLEESQDEGEGGPVCENNEELWVHTRYEWSYGEGRYYAAYTWYTCERIYN